jgi:secernin
MPMRSDMAVALGRTTSDGHALFGYNDNGPFGEPFALSRVAGRRTTPGETLSLDRLTLAQPRRLHTTLALRAGAEWGYRCGVNERGVAVGLTSHSTHLRRPAGGLLGPEMVRLALERADSAAQAVEATLDLIRRHGQGAPSPDGGDDATLLVADPRDAFLIQMCGPYAAVRTIRTATAVTAAGLIRQDWDYLSPELPSLAISEGWTLPLDSEAGKFDYTQVVVHHRPNHQANRVRCARAQSDLDAHHGAFDQELFRRLLRAMSESLVPSRGTGAELDPSERVTRVSVVLRLGEGLPLFWCAFGAPAVSAYFPVPACTALPDALIAADGRGCLLWRRLLGWQASARRDARLLAALRAGFAGLQTGFDWRARDFLTEAGALRRRREDNELAHLAGRFLDRELSLFAEMEEGLRALPTAHTEAATARWDRRPAKHRSQ